VENYFETFERLLTPYWNAARISEWWSTPIATLGGRRTPHQLCLDGLARELERDMREQMMRDGDPLEIIRDCQAILAEYLPPDGITANDALNRLLEILDGPRARAAFATPGARDV
jgi:hypothetical protein